MGSSSSKFRRYLQNGDEYAALQVFQNSLELQQSLDPNSSYGDPLKHNTPLHLAAKHAMKPLLRIFLTELKGNPNKQNAVGETPLHLVCQGDLTRSMVNQERRALCLNLILQWKSSDNEEKINLTSLDSEGNTALHYAAATGLKKCVEILVSHGAPLFIENKSSETVCDLAVKNKHEDIAQYLETKMLFYGGVGLDFVFMDYSARTHRTHVVEELMENKDIHVIDWPACFPNLNLIEQTDTSDVIHIINEADNPEEAASGLRAQDLQEAKDQLLVETSDMFHVPLFTAEVLLRNHEWSRQNLLDAWMKDPILCCKEVGVPPPSSALNFAATQDSLKTCCEQIQNEYQRETLNSPVRTVPVREEVMCDICAVDIDSEEELIQVPCLHQFCKQCWKVYLTAKIVDGETYNILCPAYQCPHMVPVDVIEKLVSTDMVKRYLQFDIKAFVESNPSMKWCPYPGCARAVKIPELEKINDEIMAISFTVPPSVSHSVDCGNGHYFCWECLGEAHAPCGCEKWREWHNKIAEIKPQELKNTYAETEEAENCLWMVTNSKPCPNCKCPIQKNEGCNHMKCYKCKYEYCWICLESWKKHSPTTGGYFRCNRHDAVKRAEVKAESLINEAEEHNKHMQELKRFLQYYTRFKNHENSYKFEEPFIKSIQEKINILTAAMCSYSMTNVNMSFLQDAIYELLRARRILCGAYVYGYYLEDNGYNKTIFEYLQSDLEEATEKLSDAVARTYLQTPQSKIVQMIAHVKRKRLDLLTAVHKGLIPPETPPSMRKSRKRRLPGLMGIDPVDDPLLSQAILESLENIDPNDPWVVDHQGKHTNIAAVCDWPDYDSEEEGYTNPLLTSLLGACSREGCKRPRARNCRTGEIHEFCSLTCKHWEVIKPPDSKNFEAGIDPAMDMLIALEMSKLQLLEKCNEYSNGDESSAVDAAFGNSAEFSEGEGISESTNLETSEKSADFSAEIGSEQNSDVHQDSVHEYTPEPYSDKKDVELVECDSQKSAINFYLKNSCCHDSKNINVNSDINDSKTEKELFKMLQRTVENENENFTCTKETHCN